MRYEIITDKGKREVTGRAAGHKKAFAIRNLNIEVCNGEGWSVDHLATGYRIARTLTEESAKEVVRVLERKHFDLFWEKATRSPARTPRFKEYPEVRRAIAEALGVNLKGVF